jgi:hypothetical protein
MTPKTLLIVASLLAIAPVQALYAQDEPNEGDKPRPTVRTQDGGREAIGPATGRAVERSTPAPRPTPAPAPASPGVPRVETRAASAPAPSAAPAAEDQRRRQGDNGGRDRGDNPAVGRAVPRDSRPTPAPAPQSRAGGNDSRYRSGANVYVAPRANNYYYYPRRYYPYGYGAFGLGYFYYDPYTWYPPSYSSGYYGGGYYDPFYGDSFFHDIGELRISVSPRHADVYVDGYFSGRVDDYDGTFQALKLEAGPHHIQIVAPGFAPLDFDVRIEPGRKITYRGALQPYRP